MPFELTRESAWSLNYCILSSSYQYKIPTQFTSARRVLVPESMLDDTTIPHQRRSTPSQRDVLITVHSLRPGLIHDLGPARIHPHIVRLLIECHRSLTLAIRSIGIYTAATL
jgi:hypothetical protein